MSLLFRTRLSAIEPAALALTVQGMARVRVRGQVCGFVQCAGERRWAWGAFDETFQLTRSGGQARFEPPSRRGRRPDERWRGTVRVRVFGLGGVASQTVRFISGVDLRFARLPALRGKLRWSHPRVPAIAPLSMQTIQALSGAEET